MLKVNRKISSVVLAAICVLSLSAQARERDDRNKSKKDGTIIGAVIGGILGAAVEGDEGAVVGAVIGAAAGRKVGDDIDDSKDRRDHYGRDDYGRDDRYGRGRDDRYGRDRDRRDRRDRRHREFYQCQESGRGRFRSFVVVEVYRNQIVQNFGPDFRSCQRAADRYNR